MMANTWQGDYPVHNDVLDGYERTSPIGKFPSNGYCLIDITGNVWEWTCQDFTSSHLGRAGTANEVSTTPVAATCCGPRVICYGPPVPCCGPRVRCCGARVACDGPRVTYCGPGVIAAGLASPAMGLGSPSMTL